MLLRRSSVSVRSNQEKLKFLQTFVDVKVDHVNR